jgi:DNA-binding transcriptional LysR family regulator
MIGTVSLGFVPSMANEILPLIANHLKKKLPQVKLIFKESMSFEQVEALNTGNLDIGLTRLPKDLESFNYSRVVSEPYFLAVNNNHELSKKDNITVKDLHNIDFIMYDAVIGRYSFELLSSLFLNAGVKPNFVQYVSQPLVFLGLIQASLGVALLASTSKKNAPENVIFKEIQLPGWVRSDVYLAIKKQPKNSLTHEVYNNIMEALYNRVET